MILYINTMPFTFNAYGADGPEFMPVGTTFAMFGAEPNGFLLKAVSEVNDGKNTDAFLMSINPTVFTTAFKEVETLKSK